MNADLPRSPLMRTGEPDTTLRRSPWTFFVLVFAPSIPFAVLGAATGPQLIPGIPVTALDAEFASPVHEPVTVRSEESNVPE